MSGPVQAIAIASVRAPGGSVPPPPPGSSLGRPSTPGMSGVALPAGMRPPSSHARSGTGIGIGIGGGIGIGATASRQGSRPMTGARSSIGTASTSAQVQSIPELTPLNTDVTVTARPVTSGGLTGMSTAPLGPGRQIADKSYFLGELRSRLGEIEKEISSLMSRTVTIRDNNARHTQLAAIYESTLKEVRSLEGNLADLNLAIDKARTHTDISELRDIQSQLQASNDSRRAAVDDLFLQTADNEKISNKTNDKINELNKIIADKIASLGDDKEQEYGELMAEAAALDDAIQNKQLMLQQVSQRLQDYRAQMNSDAYLLHQRGVELRAEYKMLMQQQAELEEETNQQLSPAELKEKLTKKIKDENKEIEKAEKEIKEKEEAIEKVNELTREKENELQEAKKYASKATKYDAVFDREKKMMEFIESYPSVKQNESSQHTETGQRIVILLQHISSQLAVGANMPSVAQFSDMKSELSFKQSKMKSATETLETLSKELASRKDELSRIETLDVKIAAEIKALKEKMASMEKEMSEFKSEDELRAQASEIKKHLLSENQKLKKQRDAIKQQVSLLSAEYEQMKKRMSSSDVHKKLESMEAKLRTYAQTAFQLEEFVNSRKRDSEYDSTDRKSVV